MGIFWFVSIRIWIRKTNPCISVEERNRTKQKSLKAQMLCNRAARKDKLPSRQKHGVAAQQHHKIQPNLCLALMLSTPKSCLPTSTATTLHFTLEKEGEAPMHTWAHSAAAALPYTSISGRAQNPPSHSPELSQKLRFVRTWGTSISSLLLPTAGAPVLPWLSQHRTRKWPSSFQANQ